LPETAIDGLDGEAWPRWQGELQVSPLYAVAVTTEREALEFTSGGETCAGWLFRPEDATGPVPIMVMAHGFTATREESLTQFAEKFAAAGIATLVFDYRGFGDSGGSERQVLSVKSQLEDVAAAIGFARGLDGIDPARVALWGTSFGGGLALHTTASDHSLTCAIAQVPFADGPVMLGAVPPANAMRLTAKALADIRARRSGGSRVMIPAAGPPGTLAAMTSEDALKGFEAITPPGSRHENTVAASIAVEALLWRPGRRARQISCPLLVQIASNDLDTPPCPAAKVAARAPRGELRRYECGDFDVYLEPWFDRIADDQVDFLKRHLL
jgi:alpha-beta hydrolase superfamily lysophospholipase